MNLLTRYVDSAVVRSLTTQDYVISGSVLLPNRLFTLYDLPCQAILVWREFLWSTIDLAEV